MTTYSGPLLTDHGFIQAEITIVHDGTGMPRVGDYCEGGDSGHEAIIIPVPYNSHVHTGDSVVSSIPSGGSISEIVGPGGLKHRALEEATEEEVVNSMCDYLEKAAVSGVGAIIDFREGGIDGLRYIRRAEKLIDAKVRVKVMARPEQMRYDENEMRVLLKSADGIGLSAFRDWDLHELSSIADAVRATTKPFAMHCSEDVREPVDQIIELGVDHLVHMIEATRDDLQVCAENGIPIVICPRSNLFFGKIPDIGGMIDAGVTLCLGTDNAMIVSPDMFREMEFAYRLSNIQSRVDPLDILMMATWNPRKDLNLPYFMSTESSEHYLILERGKYDPAYQVVTRTSSKHILEVVEW